MVSMCAHDREVTLACAAELVATTGDSADDGEADTVERPRAGSES